MRSRSLTVVLAAALLLGLAGCSGGTRAAEDPHAPLKIGVSPQPHGEILRYVDEHLAKRAGIDLEIEKFDDYNKPNEALASGDLDANYYQHVPFLEKYKSQQGGDLVWVEPVHLEPLSVYSKKHRSLAELPTGAKITVPNDPANQFRALKLLAANGVITLRPDAGENTRLEKAVAENPKRLRFTDLAADQLPRTVDEADAAVINGNYALKAKLRDPLAVEEAKGNPYANGLVTSPKMRHDPRVEKLAELLRSPEVAKFIHEHYTPETVRPAS